MEAIRISFVVFKISFFIVSKPPPSAFLINLSSNSYLKLILEVLNLLYWTRPTELLVY